MREKGGVHSCTARGRALERTSLDSSRELSAGKHHLPAALNPCELFHNEVALLRTARASPSDLTLC